MYSDGFEFIEYLWRRRAVVAVSCVAALLITAVASVLLPVRYTAAATVLIEPPGGNDPRAATAVSPVYLESLKTYEMLASSDTLFARALDELQLRQRYPGASVESLKRKILALNKPTNTSILEIKATLDDPRHAQALAQYIAEHTVQLNEQLDQQSDQDMVQEPQRIFDDAVGRLRRAEKASDDFTKTASVDASLKDVEAMENLRMDVQRDLMRSRAELAEDLARQQTPQPADATTDTAAWTALQVASVRARIQALEDQDHRLGEQLGVSTRTLGNLVHTRESLEAELKSARDAEDAAQTKLGDVRANSAFRGVRLKVLDPGIVPQRPSFPNTPLNLAIAFAFSLAASIGFVAARFGYKRIRRAQADPVYSLR